jgi:ubiquinone/menaquinone biosynthesis C-methylase UbiE
MNHQDHVNLLREGIPSAGGVWADFGSGSGAFTLALVELVGLQSRIYSIDKRRSALLEQEQAMRTRFPTLDPDHIRYLPADFTRRLNLPRLDGAVMANSLHFHQDKEPVLSMIGSYLKPGGRLILVEYNVDLGNLWVPFPISYRTWEKLAYRSGYRDIRLLSTRPSHFLGEIYSAISFKPE